MSSIVSPSNKTAARLQFKTSSQISFCSESILITSSNSPLALSRSSHKSYGCDCSIDQHCVRTALEIPKDTADDMLFIAAMLHDVGKSESRCAGRKEGDTESHYYGHPEASKRIVEEQIIPLLDLAPEDAKRLVYYVQFHDDYVGFKPHHLRKHYERVPLPVFQNLMLLQMADAITHTWEKLLIQERYTTCKTLYDGKAEELYRWLENEKKCSACCSGGSVLQQAL